MKLASTDENITRTKPFKAAFPAPAQEKLKNSISEKEKYLNSLYEAQATGLSSGSSAMSLKTLIDETQKDLKKDKAPKAKKPKKAPKPKNTAWPTDIWPVKPTSIFNPKAATVPNRTEPNVAKIAIIKLFLAARPQGFFVP